MPTITIIGVMFIVIGDTAQKALEQVLYQGIAKYGKDFNVIISDNLRFENQNKEIKEMRQRIEALERKMLEEIKSKIDKSHNKYVSNKVFLVRNPKNSDKLGKYNDRALLLDDVYKLIEKQKQLILDGLIMEEKW